VLCSSAWLNRHMREPFFFKIRENNVIVHYSSLSSVCVRSTFTSISHRTTQTLTTRTHTHPCEYTYEILPLWAPRRTKHRQFWRFSKSPRWRLVVDGNVAYQSTHNAGKSRNKSRKSCEPWWVASHWTVLPLDYKPNHDHHVLLSSQGPRGRDPVV
jgi:hypothetical protein